jgi:hypothetical protein
MPLQAQDMPRVRQIIDTLTSESMHGRGYVNDGDKKAAEYISGQFSQIGLKSFKDSYFQSFKLNINTFPDRLKLKIGRKKLKPGQDYHINAISKAGKGRGRIIYLDTLIFKSKDRQTAFLNTKLEKNILVYHSRFNAKLIELPELVLDKIYSAKALIELKPAKLTAGLSNRQLSNPIFEIEQAFWDTLQLKKRFKLSRARFKVDAELKKSYLSQNVIGFIEGRAEPDSFLVLSAHYDHLGRMGKKVYFPGANDNASGVSMLLELARYYAQLPEKPYYSMAFMAFGAEEAGLIGSKFYTDSPLFPLERIKFLFNLDLVGTGDDGATIVNGAVFKPEFSLIQKINEEKNYLPVIQKRGFAANSDHYYFTEHKVRSFFLYTLGGIRAYHDIYDRAKSLPLTRYKEVFGLIRDFFDRLPNGQVK